MSLIAKTTLLYLLVALVVFGIGGVVTYKMVAKEVQKETDYYLYDTFRRISKAIEEGKPPGAFENERVSICELPGQAWTDTKPVFTDTLGLHPLLDRLEPHRKLTVIKKVDGTFYKMSLMDVLIESDDMYEGVVDILSQLFLFLSLALILFSFLISRRLLKPFQETLYKISRFSAKDKLPLTFSRTSTKEFRQLNSFISDMTKKVVQDYASLKEFTENASHEIQTPVAVVKTKLELLLESNDLDEKQVELIQSAHEAVSKISRISRGLALLNKIENREFEVDQMADFSSVVNKSIELFEDLAALQGLTLNSSVEQRVMLPIYPTIAEILISNLLKNAIHHNIPKGWIQVDLNQNYLSIRNTGKAPTLTPDRLFERFQKGNQSGGSLGLGLAIVKKVCEVNDWTVKYDYDKGIHEVLITFEQPMEKQIKSTK